MEAQEEQVSLGSKEQTTHLIKGKRTKRVRPQSPMPFTVTANSSNGEGDTEDHSHVNARNFDDDVNCDINNTTTTNTCSAELQGSTEEEQDMAHCLILLARGQSWESPKLFEEDDDDTNNDGFLNYSKYSSRKFMEAVTMGYECKTCNRTFPSFQALGGHRASHKKTKAASGASIMAFDDEEFQLKNKNLFYLKLSNNNNSKGNNLYSSNKNKSKVHECSVCGAEFTSGQALGGHMRRHRGPVGTTNTTLSLTPMAAVEADEYQPKKRRKLVSSPLDLDLNLPAPEDDQREPKFAFGSNQRQQPNLVLSAPSLVDCHY